MPTSVKQSLSSDPHVVTGGITIEVSRLPDKNPRKVKQAIRLEMQELERDVTKEVMKMLRKGK